MNLQLYVHSGGCKFVVCVGSPGKAGTAGAVMLDECVFLAEYGLHKLSLKPNDERRVVHSHLSSIVFLPGSYTREDIGSSGLENLVLEQLIG